MTVKLASTYSYANGGGYSEQQPLVPETELGGEEPSETLREILRVKEQGGALAHVGKPKVTVLFSISGYAEEQYLGSFEMSDTLRSVVEPDESGPRGHLEDVTAMSVVRRFEW